MYSIARLTEPCLSNENFNLKLIHVHFANVDVPAATKVVQDLSMYSIARLTVPCLSNENLNVKLIHVHFANVDVPAATKVVNKSCPCTV